MHEETLGREDLGVGGSPFVHYDAESDMCLVFGIGPVRIFSGDALRGICNAFGIGEKEALESILEGMFKEYKLQRALELLAQAFDQIRQIISKLDCERKYVPPEVMFIPAPGRYKNKKTRHRPEYG